MSDCPICNKDFVKHSQAIKGLCYCLDCENFFYQGDEPAFSTHEVLKTVGEISFEDVLFSHRGIAVASDLSQIEPRILEIAKKIVCSDEFNFKERILELNTGDEQGIWSLVDDIVTLFRIEDYCCEYIVRLFAYAVNKIEIVEPPDKIIEERKKTGILQSFSIDKQKVMSGDRISVKWSVCIPRHKCILKKNGDEVFASRLKEDHYECIVDKETTFTLIVLRQDGVELVVEERKVEIVESVKINSFIADNDYILESQSVKLSWSVSNAERIVLLPDSLDVSDKDNVQLFPMKSQEYQLVAIGFNGEIISSNVTVSVVPLPQCVIDMKNTISKLQLPSISNIQLPNIPTELTKYKTKHLFDYVQNIAETMPNKIQKILKQ